MLMKRPVQCGCAQLPVLHQFDLIESSVKMSVVIESAACMSHSGVIYHSAVRGYKVRLDTVTGSRCGIAKKGAPKLIDEGEGVLQTKVDQSGFCIGD